MNIAIVGAGHVGGALARLWSPHAHQITIGLRSGPSDQRALPAGVRSATIPDAVRSAELVSLCVPWPSAEAAIHEAGDLTGKILVDATNPLLPDLSGLALGTSTSAAEQIAAWAPGARVVKAFNTIGAALLGNARFGAETADGFFCGDDVSAKNAVRSLIEQAGLAPLDVGPLSMARTLEPLALLWIDLAVRQKHQPSDFAFKLLHRTQKD